MSVRLDSENEATLEQAREQIRALADEIAALASRETNADIFYDGLVENLIHALAAAGGAVWLTAPGGPIRCRHREGAFVSGRPSPEHVKRIERVAQTGQPAIFPVKRSEGSPGDASTCLVLAAPFGEAGAPDGVVEIVQRGDADPAAQRGGLRFLVQMCEHATQWSRRQKLAVLSDRASHWDQCERFVRSVHQSLDRQTTAFAICNEGRELLGCDRVSLAVARGPTCRIEAVSGQDTLESRSNTVTALAKLAQVVIAAREPFWFEPSQGELSPQIDAVIEPYLEASPVSVLGVLPLARTRPGSPAAGADEPDQRPERRELVGALIIEQFQPQPTKTQLADRASLVQTHAALALSNALEVDQVLLLTPLRKLGKLVETIRSTSRAKLLSSIFMFLTVLLGLVIVPLPFDLSVRGTLEPIVRRDVFAMVGGKVIAVHVEHGDVVKRGQPLLELENGDLEVELLELMGNRSVAQQELLAAKLTRSEEAQLSGQDRTKLAGRRVELEEQLENIDREIRLLETEKERLTVRSPIDGRVVTWDVQRRLMDRPVQVGEVLATVVDPDQGWELELQLPERRLGHLQHALAGLPPGEKLAVSFVPAHAPGMQFEGRIEQVHNTARPVENEGNCVSVRSSIQGETPPQPRPGVSVIARIHCGRQPAGYVWFHDAVEWLERAVFIYL